MYILVMRLCIIPNVFKYIICTTTMTMCGTGMFGKLEGMSRLGFKQVGFTFFHYRDGAWRVIFLFVSGCCWLLYRLPLSLLFIKHQNRCRAM